MLKNLNLVEKVCVILFFFIAVFCIYICASEVFKFFVFETNVSKFKDAMTFSLSASSLFLALLLYSDWREKYVAESIDKDLREIKALVSSINYIVNRFPTTQSKDHVEEREEFFKIFWKLRVLNSYIEYSNFNRLNKEIELYLTSSHDFLNQMQQDLNFKKITDESKLMFDNINGLIEFYRNENLKT